MRYIVYGVEDGRLDPYEYLKTFDNREDAQKYADLIMCIDDDYDRMVIQEVYPVRDNI